MLRVKRNPIVKGIPFLSPLKGSEIQTAHFSHTQVAGGAGVQFNSNYFFEASRIVRIVGLYGQGKIAPVAGTVEIYCPVRAVLTGTGGAAFLNGLSNPSISAGGAIQISTYANLFSPGSQKLKTNLLLPPGQPYTFALFLDVTFALSDVLTAYGTIEYQVL